MKIAVSEITKKGLRTIQNIRDAGIDIKEIIPADVERGRNHDVCIGNVSVAGTNLSVRFGKSLLANVEPGKAEYVVNSVMADGEDECIWFFRQEAEEFRGIARLYDLENYGWAIALCGRFKHQNVGWGITKVIPLDSLVGNVYGPEELAGIKIALATMAFAGQRIDPLSPSARARLPLPADETVGFESVEERVERTLAQREDSLALGPEALDELIAVQRLAGDFGQHHGLGRPFEQFPVEFHDDTS